MNITKRFGAFTAIDNMSLSVKQGEFLTLLGPSGCGKTTTLRIIGGFETPEEGTVSIGGRTVNHLPPFKRQVNTVFQSYALFPHMSILDNVAYSLKIQRVPKSEIKTRCLDMLDLVGLTGKSDNLPSELSGGQKQRVALARALVSKPRLLLLDEPLSALDAKLRREMQVELKHMQERLGITFVYVTHDQEEAMVMSDRVAVFSVGKIQQLSSPKELFDRPKTRFVAEFMGTSNFFEGTVLGSDTTSCKVELSGGLQVVAKTDATLEAGRAVSISIRPPKIAIDDGNMENVENLIRASFEEAIYEGAMVRLVFRLATGEAALVVNSPEALPFDYSTLSNGAKMNLFMPSDAILVYPK